MVRGRFRPLGPIPQLLKSYRKNHCGVVSGTLPPVSHTDCRPVGIKQFFVWLQMDIFHGNHITMCLITENTFFHLQMAGAENNWFGCRLTNSLHCQKHILCLWPHIQRLTAHGQFFQCKPNWGRDTSENFAMAIGCEDWLWQAQFLEYDCMMLLLIGKGCPLNRGKTRNIKPLQLFVKNGSGRN